MTEKHPTHFLSTSLLVNMPTTRSLLQCSPLLITAAAGLQAPSVHGFAYCESLYWNPPGQSFWTSTARIVPRSSAERLPLSATKTKEPEVSNIIPTKTDHKSRKKTPNLDNDACLSSLTVNNLTWDENIAALLEYNATHGTVNIPITSKKHPKLALWVKNLWQQKGAITAEQIQQFDSIGFLWGEASKKEKEDKQWEEMYQKLMAYKEENGHCLVPCPFDEDPKLGLWVLTQRRANTEKRLREDRQELLKTIGFVWRLQDFVSKHYPKYEELWEERYQELIEFKKVHGHTKVPRNNTQKKGLRVWVYNQRTKNSQGILRMDRKEKLDNIGFIWDFETIREGSWHTSYLQVKAYYQRLNEYQKIKEDNPEVCGGLERLVLGKPLTTWMAAQRRIYARGSLDPQRVELMNSIVLIGGRKWHQADNSSREADHVG
jgi:Helicase associated domain